MLSRVLAPTRTTTTMTAAARRNRRAAPRPAGPRGPVVSRRTVVQGMLGAALDVAWDVSVDDLAARLAKCLARRRSRLVALAENVRDARQAVAWAQGLGIQAGSQRAGGPYTLRGYAARPTAH